MFSGREIACGRACGRRLDRPEWSLSVELFKRRNSGIHFGGKAMVTRRDLLSAAGVSLAASVLPLSRAQAANPAPVRLVLVHGRSQQGRDPGELKSIWIDTLQRGAAKINRSLPDGLEV